MADVFQLHSEQDCQIPQADLLEIDRQLLREEVAVVVLAKIYPDGRIEKGRIDAATAKKLASRRVSFHSRGAGTS